MLKNLILPDGIMSMNAEGLLKVLGKPALPLIDILIRESIQNSLDASIRKKGVTISISWKSWPKENDLQAKMKKILGDQSAITKRLCQRIKAGEQGMILIRDTGTTGLTGAIEKTKNFYGSTERQNFYNLVFNIGRNHGVQGSGGSYGFGKTIYYKVSSSGLVLYYSRCLNEKSIPEHRIVFSMVSVDEMNAAKNSGIAWWGKRVYTFDSAKNIMPLTGKDALQVLKTLGIEPFSETETGTLIGIVSPAKGTLIPLNEKSDGNRPFSDHFSTHISEAVLKWYWPRMMDATGKLKVSVNDRWLNTSASKYSLYSELLQAAIAGNKLDISSVDEERKVFFNNNLLPSKERPDHPFSVYNIISRRHASFIGTLAILEVPFIQNMGEEHFYNKIAMIRKPGMVVFYESDGIVARTDKKLFGLFLVNSDLSIGRNQEERDGYIMDDAFRKCEDPSHSTWNSESLDHVTDAWFRTLVRTARKQITDKANKHLNKAELPSGDTPSMSLAAKLLGSLLFADGKQTAPVPKISFGTSSGGGSGSSGKKQKPKINILGTSYLENNNILVDFKVENVDTGKYHIRLFAMTDNGVGYSYDDWENEGLKGFPLRFVKIEVKAAETGRKALQSDGKGVWPHLEIKLTDANRSESILNNTSSNMLLLTCRAEVHMLERDILFDINF